MKLERMSHQEKKPTTLAVLRKQKYIKTKQNNTRESWCGQEGKAKS